MFDEYKYIPGVVSEHSMEEPVPKRHCTKDENVELFERTFQKNPRSVQIEVFPYLCHEISQKRNFILEMPTGGGKSLIGAFSGN